MNYSILIWRKEKEKKERPTYQKEKENKYNKGKKEMEEREREKLVKELNICFDNLFWKRNPSLSPSRDPSTSKIIQL